MKRGKIIAFVLCLFFIGKTYAQRDSIPLIIADSLKAVYIYADTGKAPNRLDAQGRKVGLWEKRYPNGRLRYRGHFREGYPNGVFKYYWDNDSMQNIATYSDKGKVAYAKTFYENGGVLSIGKFIDEKKDSIWLFYDINFRLWKKEQYALGKKEGKSISFYPNGNPLESKVYHNDMENGLWQQYFDNGQLKLEAKYVNGKLEGAIKIYDDGNPDKPSIQGNYVHDKMDGSWIFLNRLNDTWDTVRYKDDKPIDHGKFTLTQEKLDSLKQKYQGLDQQLENPGMEQPENKRMGNDDNGGGGE